MYERILVPLDGSRAAELALPAALSVATAFGSTIVLIHVVEARPPKAIHGETHLAAAGPAKEYLEKIAASLREGKVKVETHVHEGGEHAVAAALVAHEKEFGHRLVVMAAHGRRGFGDLLSASIPYRTAAKGGAAVLLVCSALEPKRILVPLDGREDHEAAIPAALAFAKAYDAPIKLVDVVPRNGGEEGGQSTLFERLSPALSGASLEFALSGATEYLARIAQKLQGEGRSVEWAIERGRPVKSLVRIAEAESDLVMLSTHRRMGIDAKMEGCVAYGVASAYRGNLLVVPITE
jgi:nucleotide-binding universal stress UspA family protein